MISGELERDDIEDETGREVAERRGCAAVLARLSEVAAERMGDGRPSQTSAEKIEKDENSKKLVRAAQRGDEEDLTRLLDDGCDIDAMTVETCDVDALTVQTLGGESGGMLRVYCVVRCCAVLCGAVRCCAGARARARSKSKKPQLRR